MLVSALPGKASIPAKTLEEAAGGSLTPLSHADILAEYELEILQRKRPMLRG